ncbi:MAG: aspartate-semialdehyde dehydrogenase [Gammaproteobacteria bacterium]|nr:aspartate-semialdehyde dehydrogenase [Gammaproteobacteria bacterium]
MAESMNIAVVGAKGLVGKAVLELLEQRDFPVAKLYCLEKEGDSDTSLLFKNKNIEIKSWQGFDFSSVAIAIFAEVDGTQVELTVAAGKAGAVVITNQPVFRHAQDIPLVVAGVNNDAIADYATHNIIATPDANTVHVLRVLQSVYESVGISSINLSCLQAVSAAGEAGVSELASQTAKLLNVQSIESKVFAKQIAFNLLPQVGEVLENGYSREETEIATGIQKVLADHALEVEPSITQVAVFFGDTLDIIFSPQHAINLSELSKLIAEQEGVEISTGEVISPVTEGAESETLSVSRLRQVLSETHSFRMVLIADNVRTGRALNMVKVAEILQMSYLD